jgi:ceramide glucosyltransferase
VIYFLYFFAAVLIYLSILSLRGGFRYLTFIKRELAKNVNDYAPFVSIIAPCRGLDAGLKENLTALYRQNYPAYEIIFVVDDARDAAVSVIENAWKSVATRTKSKLIVAGKAVESGQKVHNLRRGVEEASDESKVFVFVDSDARPAENWLRDLVAPLADERVGAATGYRWFVSKRRNFASELRAVWNASIASALSADADKNFCWGGATAVRRATFEGIKMSERWRGTLSDDFTITRAMRENNLQIFFVPQCLTASIEDCTLGEMLEFTTRQMKITRVYAGHFWRASLIGSAIFTAVFYSLLILTIWRAVAGEAFWLPFAFGFVIFALGAIKAWLRLEAVKLVLKNYKRELSRSLWTQIFFFPLTPPVYLYNCLVAAASRRIKWRGIVYELKSPTETVIVSRKNLQHELAGVE